jgi:uncharacterized membrane protein
MKAIGLAVIFVYAFFKFAGRTGCTITSPSCSARCRRRREGHAGGAGAREAHHALFTAAGRHFNHGQRAFFFALGYLGWFVSPYVFMGTTAPWCS